MNYFVNLIVIVVHFELFWMFTSCKSFVLLWGDIEHDHFLRVIICQRLLGRLQCTDSANIRRSVGFTFGWMGKSRVALFSLAFVLPGVVVKWRKPIGRKRDFNCQGLSMFQTKCLSDCLTIDNPFKTVAIRNRHKHFCMTCCTVLLIQFKCWFSVWV